MDLRPRTQAVLLLTAHFRNERGASEKPLTPTEWAAFARHLAARGLTPEDLLGADLGSILEGSVDARVTVDRLGRLLQRGTALALVLERWERAGLWTLIRSDNDYPRALKSRLGWGAPPFLVGSGNPNLLNVKSLAVVGSRNANEDDLSFARAAGRSAAEASFAVVSGGARGIDEAAMTGALDAQGQAIGVLADSLLRAATSAKHRTSLRSGDLALVTPFNPEAGFNAGNAMARNKYVYCMSEAAVVVATDVKRGGTWSGAVEALRAAWVPVWVPMSSSPSEGIKALTREGAKPLAAGALRVGELGAPAAAAKSVPEGHLF